MRAISPVKTHTMASARTTHILMLLIHKPTSDGEGYVRAASAVDGGADQRPQVLRHVEVGLDIRVDVETLQFMSSVASNTCPYKHTTSGRVKQERRATCRRSYIRRDGPGRPSSPR